MQRIDVITIFPAMVKAVVSDGIVHRATQQGLVDIHVLDLRDFTENRHRSVDDAPFGGGPGMVIQAEPCFRAIDHARPAAHSGVQATTILLTPRGRRFDQAMASRFARSSHLILLCGRYEGIDERVALGMPVEEVSLGDYVLTGGEVAALAVVEATVRLLPGALGDEESAQADSFSDGLLDHPHYTRPAVVRGLAVPDVLLSGDHERVRRWRRKESLRSTRDRRPDLLAAAVLTQEDRELLRQIESEEQLQASGTEG